MRSSQVFGEAFLDGITMAGFLGGLRTPYEATELLAPDRVEPDSAIATEAVSAPRKSMEMEVSLRYRERVFIFFSSTHIFLLVTTVLISLLQGFRIGGFSLDRELLFFLGAVGILELGGLTVLSWRSFYGLTTTSSEERHLETSANAPKGS